MSWQWEQEERGVCKTEKLIEMYEFPDGWMALRKKSLLWGEVCYSLQFDCWFLGGEENQSAFWQKALGARLETISTFNPIMAPGRQAFSPLCHPCSPFFKVNDIFAQA